MIHFEEIHLSFEDRDLFTGMSFQIKSGDKVLLTGPSGCGKSSIFRMLLGFLSPDRGVVSFLGQPLERDQVWKVRRQIAYVDQDVSLGRGPVKNYLQEVFQLAANGAQNAPMEKILQHAKVFSLPDDLFEKALEELSGGERQRLALVVATMLGRKLFLLDEVTSSIDPGLKKRIAEYFLSQPDWTCLVISHDRIWHGDSRIRKFDVEGQQWEP